MNKITKASLLTAAKISFGCAASIIICTVLGLRYSATAGLITVLSIQSTKRETTVTAAKRISAFGAALLISAACFGLIGYTTAAFTLYLFIFILLCEMFNAQSAIVPISVLITHILSERTLNGNIIFNESMLLIIGTATGIMLNLYLHRDTRKMAELKAKADNEIKAIIGRMSERILLSDKSDYNADCFVRLEGYMSEAENAAMSNHQNSFRSRDNYDILYLEMRRSQIVILREMYKAVKEMDAPPEQVTVISALLKKMSAEYHEDNSVDDLLTDTNRILLDMKEQPMPSSRSEFENRAVLYTLLIRTKEFLAIKNVFMKSRLVTGV